MTQIQPRTQTLISLYMSLGQKYLGIRLSLWDIFGHQEGKIPTVLV